MDLKREITLIRTVAAVLAKHFSSENCARFAQDHFAAFAAEEGLKERLDEVIAECAKANDGKTLPLRIGVYPNRIESVQIGTACDRARLAANVRKKRNESYYTFFDLEMMSEEKTVRASSTTLTKPLKKGGFRSIISRSCALPTVRSVVLRHWPAGKIRYVGCYHLLHLFRF